MRFGVNLRHAMAGILSVLTAALGGCGGASPFEPAPPGSTASRPADSGVIASASTATADPSRGEKLFAMVPAAGLLACMDCHSDDPVTKNFGNIFVGRNAPALIERAVSANTGGMGYFARYLAPADFADIAAYLGNTPRALDFGPVMAGGASASQAVQVRSSTKEGIEPLAFTLEGDFVRSGGDCGSTLARYASCTVEIRFQPTGAGARAGALLIKTGASERPVRIPLNGMGTAASAQGMATGSAYA